MKVLVTGGIGYLGRNICYALSDCGIEAVVIDHVDDADKYTLPGCHFYKADITDKESISKILDEHPDIDFVIHNAMVSAVAKSVNHPYDFYYQNVVTSMELFHLL